ncbi:hypothetical protein [Flavobacterium taihuense]|uniref:Competence protein n=1 Tax=Flavobacterium taihuense TaxID=2857508 RepID=A0ABS6XRR4_9FLAO|nr:hypothetical protein [Flavobacterium taihuense]MBW4359363.1 hypothetical protein [Flavobacterium taihuense]
MDNSSIQKEQNEYAKNVKGEPIYILEAESGRKGYWCMGCDTEMEAVKRIKNIHHKSYFRHIAKDKDIERKCTFSNQDYRHRLAIDILQRTKRIKVPNLYKYAPDGSEAILLEETKFVEAHSVRAELTFYEDDNGKVQWGKNPEIENKNLLIRPDVTFFDIHGKPILLIEIVVTHKLDDDKKAKINRLGINTIQITIPKDSPENIAKNLLITKNTKWVFNNVEQNTNYFQLPNRASERILPIDTIEMGFFRESFVCRENQIRNLIRGLKKCVGSQHYRSVERKLESEISRIEEATRKHQSRLDEIQAGIEREIHSELESRREELESRRGKLEENGLDLEKRYFKRRQEITDEQADTDREIELRHRIGKSEEDIRREFESEEARIDSELSRIKREQGHIVDEIQSESRFEENFDGEKLRIEDEERDLEQEFADLERQEREGFESLRKKFQPDEGTNGEFTKFTIEERIRSEFERKHEQVVERVNNRDVQPNDELSERIKTILELRGVLDDYNDVQATLERCRTGKEIVKIGSYKEWD